MQQQVFVPYYFSRFSELIFFVKHLQSWSLAFTQSFLIDRHLRRIWKSVVIKRIANGLLYEVAFFIIKANSSKFEIPLITFESIQFIPLPG